MKEKILYIVLFLLSSYAFLLPCLNNDYNEILDNVNTFISNNINMNNELGVRCLAQLLVIKILIRKNI